MVLRRRCCRVLVVGWLALAAACASTPRDNGTGPTLAPGSTVIDTTTIAAPPPLGTDATSSTPANQTAVLSLQLAGPVRTRLVIPDAVCALSPSATTISGQSGDGSQFSVTVQNPVTGSWGLANPSGKPQVQNLKVVIAGKPLGSPASGNISIYDALATRAQQIGRAHV